MTAIFHDAKQDTKLKEDLENNRPPKIEIDEVLYADDTILFSTNTEILEDYFHIIETAAAKYGLKLN